MAFDDSLIGVFMVEQPADWWVPPGFTTTPRSSVPMSATDPTGRERFIYPIPDYRPPERQIETVCDVILRELGPPPFEGLGPEIHHFVGADRESPLGIVNREILAPLDAGAMLLHLANYGIDASIVGGTEELRRRGWIDDTGAGEIRRDLNLLALVVGNEIARAPDMAPSTVRMAARSAAGQWRSMASVGSPIVLRLQQPSNAALRVVDVVEADPPTGSAAAGGRTVHAWLERIRAGRVFDREQAARYEFNQIYVVKDTGNGYWILDSYGLADFPLGGGPVSRKFTQLADIQLESARAMLREAYQKYRPGLMFAEVPSKPIDLMDRTIQGQLWLEIPVQTKPIPVAILSIAREFNVKIRDVTGKIFE